jgi:UPF0755 protein
MNRRARRIGLATLLVALTGAVVVYLDWQARLRPLPAAPERWVRFESDVRRAEALSRLEREGFIQDAGALETLARWWREDPTVKTGTYTFRPGMTASEVLASLRRPVRQMVRIPEGWWIARTAELLERKNVATAEEYIRLANDPSAFRHVVDFPLLNTTLEGYLYPDTYDLPPLIGARAVIERQLRNFQEKVVKRAPPGADLRRALKIASMVELEAALDAERPKIAGVIENRLRRGMPLDIDATVLYALQEWKVLGPGVVRTVESPYNTYLNRGLPPGPIGSPSWRSIAAALEPDEHEYLFFVAMPDRSHLFSKSYDVHRANIRKRLRALREEQR